MDEEQRRSLTQRHGKSSDRPECGRELLALDQALAVVKRERRNMGDSVGAFGGSMIGLFARQTF